MAFELPSTESGAPGIVRGLALDAIEAARKRRDDPRPESRGGTDMAPAT
jgi:hypothetical protein